MERLAVLFPGVRYGVDCPLLYYARFIYEMEGCHVTSIQYPELGNKKNVPLEKYASRCLENAKKQIKADILSRYDEVLFISKSIGTVIAAALEDVYNPGNVTHIMLTPINGTLDYMERERNYKCIVTGLADKSVDHMRLREICCKNNLPLTEIEGVGHRLETRNDLERNLEVLGFVTGLYQM